jgi:DNA-binding response OmpR family regulator
MLALPPVDRRPPGGPKFEIRNPKFEIQSPRPAPLHTFFIPFLHAVEVTSVRRILVVEDDPKTGASIELYLRHAGFETTLARTGTDGLAHARGARPDAIVLDLMLPGVNGLEICRALRAESNVPIIILTARSTEDDKLRGLDLGADDYVTKPFSPRELVARVNAVLRRSTSEMRASTPIIDGVLVVDEAAHQVTLRGAAVPLTAAELRILARLLAAPNRVFTREELLGGDALDRTVDVHIKNLRRKIEDDRTSPTRIVTVTGVGYKYVPQR